MTICRTCDTRSGLQIVDQSESRPQSHTMLYSHQRDANESYVGTDTKKPCRAALAHSKQCNDGASVG